MRKALHTKPLSISLCDEDYNQIKKITDEKMISLAEWFRAAAKLKLKQDEQGETTHEN